jgi:hypothetical protein
MNRADHRGPARLQTANPNFNPRDPVHVAQFVGDWKYPSTEEERLRYAAHFAVEMSHRNQQAKAALFDDKVRMILQNISRGVDLSRSESRRAHRQRDPG